MNNFNQHEDDFLTLRLGQPSSSKPSVATSSTPSSSSKPSVATSSTPNSETFPWGFEILPNVRVSQNLVLPRQHPGVAAEPVTPDPVQLSRVGSVRLVGKPEHVPAPFPWATTKRATVHSVVHLLANQITRIRGEVECKTCRQKYWMEYDLQEKFNEVSNYIVNNWWNFHDRAPATWTNPSLPSCRHCKQEGSARPVLGDKKKNINWLFLFLGQMLGCCTLGHLRYFCKHTSNHRTGAKDRLLYFAYLELHKQLHPTDQLLPYRA